MRAPSYERPFMPLTPQDRVRKQVAGELVPKIAELLYQCDKGSPHAKLTDLRSEEARAVYLADALMLTSAESRHERVIRVHAADAEQFAYADKEQADVEWQARQDVIKFGTPIRSDAPRFSVIRPGTGCLVCHEEVITNRVTVIVTENLHGEAHGLCCAKDEARFERIDDFLYRVKGGL